MKKFTLLKTLLLLCALIVGSGTMWGADAVYYTLTPASTGTNSSPHNSYNEAATITIDKIGWNVTANSYLVPWRIGGKGATGSPLTTDRTVYSTTGMGSAITKVELTVGAASSVTVNSLKLIVASDASFNTVIDEVSKTFAANSTITFIPTSPATEWAKNAYYKFVFNVTISATSNKFIEFTNAIFYKQSDIEPVATPSFTVTSGTYKTAQNVSINCETADAEIHYTMTEDGSTPAEPTKSDASFISTPISVTKSGTIIKARAFKEGMLDSEVATATYTIKPDQPSFDVPAGAVYTGTELTITQAAGLSIRYTIDGTDPTYTYGTPYSTPIEITKGMTVKAVAYDAYNNESNIKSATYTITYPGAVIITPKYTFYGKTASFSGNTDFSEVSGTEEDVVVTYSKGTSDYLYASSTAMRFYSGNTLKIDAPSGKTIRNIIFTVTNGTDNMTSTPTGYSTDEHIWTGNASSVTFTRSIGSYLQFTNITVVLANKITLASACTDGEKYYGTFSSSKSFKVPADVTVAEIGINEGKLNVVAYSTGAVVPANTGVMISSATAGDHTLEVANDGTSVLGASNCLKPSGDIGIDADGMSAAASGCKYYRLTMHNGTQIGYYWGAAEGAAFALGANKAYLAVPVAAARSGFSLFGDDETTGIETVDINTESTNSASEYYNLNGQRVANPSKGLYIVNGKKVIIK